MLDGSRELKPKPAQQAPRDYIDAEAQGIPAPKQSRRDAALEAVVHDSLDIGEGGLNHIAGAETFQQIVIEVFRRDDGEGLEVRSFRLFL